MATIFRWLLRIFFGLVTGVLLAVVVVYWMASRSLPDYSATHRVAGISGAIEIVRDNANVPHIFAERDADVFFGLGFAHASRRPVAGDRAECPRTRAG